MAKNCYRFYTMGNVYKKLIFSRTSFTPAVKFVNSLSEVSAEATFLSWVTDVGLLPPICLYKWGDTFYKEVKSKLMRQRSKHHDFWSLCVWQALKKTLEPTFPTMQLNRMFCQWWKRYLSRLVHYKWQFCTQDVTKGTEVATKCT